MIRGLGLVSITSIMKLAKQYLAYIMDLKITLDNESMSIDQRLEKDELSATNNLYDYTKIFELLLISYFLKTMKLFFFILSFSFFSAMVFRIFLGLEHDLKLLNSIAHTFPIKKSHQLVQLSHPMAIVSQEIDSLQTVNQTIVLDKNYSTELYVETFTTTPIKWSEKNYYWVDKDSKRVIRSHQHVHPYEDVIEIEFYYIYK
jgi:hypothetical protein